MNEEIYLIPFTQYPGWHAVFFECKNKDTYARAVEIIKQGAHFEVEVLSTGMIYLTCELGNGFVTNKLSKNGPEIYPAIDELMETAYERLGIS